MNPRIPHRVRFVPEHERIQIDTTCQTFDQEDIEIDYSFNLTNWI